MHIDSNPVYHVHYFIGGLPMTKKQLTLFDTWLELNDFIENELDSDSLNFVYQQIENNVSIEDIEYFG